MENDASSSSSQDTREPIRSKDGRELPEDEKEKLKDAVWAGLAQKMREDKAIFCRQNGHIWVEEPDGKTVCKRCGRQSTPSGENAEVESAENSTGGL